MPGRTSERLPLDLVYEFMKEHGLATEAQAIHDSQGRVSSAPSYNSTIRRGRAIRLLQDKRLLGHFIATEWPPGQTQAGQKEIESCLSVYSRFLRERKSSIDTP
jgi:hypothetical protein